MEPPPTGHAPAQVFVGRDRELQTLRAALAEVRAGRGRLVLLAGEPGIGKTRLAEELVRDLPPERVLWGRCHEGEGAPAYWPWTQALRGYVRRREPDRLRAELGAGAADLAQVLPAIRERLPDLAAPPALEPEAARFRLFDGVTGFLQRASEPAPLAVVLDDLHLADSESLLLLKFVATEILDRHLLVLGTYREVEMRQAAAVPRILGELARVSQRVELGGLSEPDVGRLVRDAGGLTAPEKLVASIHRVTEGNPFFVEEVVELLRAEGGTPARGFRVPASVRDAIRRRLDPLRSETRNLLAVAAVMGREFDLAPLERAACRTAAETLAMLAEGVALGVVAEAPGPPGRHRFAHALTQQTLYDDLPLAERAELHRRAGEAIEALHGADPAPVLGDLARHFFHAGPASLPKGIEYATRAGDRAFVRLGYAEAAGHYERALQAELVVGSEPGERWSLLFNLARSGDRSPLGEGPARGAGPLGAGGARGWRAPVHERRVAAADDRGADGSGGEPQRRPSVLAAAAGRRLLVGL